MQIFELNWSWYEDYTPYLFSHPDKTHEQFQADVYSLFVKYGDEYLGQEMFFASAESWTEYVADKLPELGYEYIRPMQVSVFGAFIINGDCEDDVKFGKIIGDDLYKKAIEHNRKVDERQ